MLPEYDWQDVGTQVPEMGIHKTTGVLTWNAKAHQMIGFAKSVQLSYDEETNAIALQYGFDYAVAMDGQNRYFVHAQDALEECGLVFPLDDHLVGEPVYLLNSHNMIVFSLG